MDAVSPESFLNTHGTTETVGLNGSSRHPRPSPGGRDGDLTFVNPQQLLGRPVAQRERIVADWLPAETVSLSYGDGGVGKSLLAQQLMTSCATAKPWCGLPVTRCKALGLFCEDDQAEMHRRQDAINESYGLNFADLAGMRWASGVGQDNALVKFQTDGSPIITSRLDQLRQAAIEFGARLLVIDTASDTFGGE